MAIVTRLSDGARDGDAWTLTESRPEHLVGLVESIWYFEVSIPYARERHFPNGRVGLVVQLESPFHVVTDATRERCATVCLSGLQTRPTIVEAPSRRSRVLGVRLSPAGAYMVAGSSLRDASERVVDLADLVGCAASELAERCAEGRSAEDRVRWRAEGREPIPSVRRQVLDPLDREMSLEDISVRADELSFLLDAHGRDDLVETGRAPAFATDRTRVLVPLPLLG